jgi:hypothetical protein
LSIRRTPLVLQKVRSGHRSESLRATRNSASRSILVSRAFNLDQKRWTGLWTAGRVLGFFRVATAHAAPSSDKGFDPAFTRDPPPDPRSAVTDPPGRCHPSSGTPGLSEIAKQAGKAADARLFAVHGIA